VVVSGGEVVASTPVASERTINGEVVVSDRRRIQRDSMAMDVIPNGLFTVRRLASHSHGFPRPIMTSSASDPSMSSALAGVVGSEVGMRQSALLPPRSYPRFNMKLQRVRMAKIARVVGLAVLSGVFVLCLAIMLYVSPPRGPPPSSPIWSSPDSSPHHHSQPHHSHHSHHSSQHVRPHSHSHSPSPTP